MAKATIVLMDSDLNAGRYQAKLRCEEMPGDKGHTTAAQITTAYLQSQIGQPMFEEAVSTYTAKLLEEMGGADKFPMAKMPAVMELVLTDTDLSTGRYKIEMLMPVGDQSGETQPTAAQAAAIYLRLMLNDVAVRQRVWAFAEELVHDSADHRIANLDYAPGGINDAAQIAA